MNNIEVLVFCWHVHHDDLVEPLWGPIEKRIDYIKKNKPASEQKLRLRLLKPVRGQLPIAVVEAWEAHLQARAAYDQARATYDQAGEAYGQAGEAYGQAEAAYDQAGAAYYQVLAGHTDEINALHAQECPDCPWDGKTIFSWEEQT